MISSEKEYESAMREMILKVQAGYEPPFDASAEEMELLSDCIRRGYLNGCTTDVGLNGQIQELRTMDGKMHPVLYNHVITPKGFAFLKPKNTDKKSTAALLISLIALLVSILSNLDKIFENFHLILSLFS